MWNRAIGGLRGTFFLSLTQRGLGDRLTIQLPLLKYLGRKHKILYQDLIKISPCHHFGIPHYRLLIMDPGALNIRGSMGIEPIIKQQVQECAREVTTNPRVTRLWDSEASIQEDSLITTLVSMRPYHARLATEIFRCSDAGTLRILCGLYEKTRSTINLTLQRRREEGSGSLVIEARLKERAWKRDIQLLWRSANLNTFFHQVMSWGNCTTQLAEQMRKVTWGFTVHGATIPCPIEQVALSPWDDLSPEFKKRSIILSTSHQYRSTGSKSWRVLGPYMTYFGSSTQEKGRKTVVTQAEVTSTDRATRRLGTILSWANYIKNASLITLVNSYVARKACHNSATFSSGPRWQHFPPLSYSLRPHVLSDKRSQQHK
jgi:hypothetical protein